MLEIQVLSERKGSNPGGRCLIPYRGTQLGAYLKYCTNSKLPRNHPFRSAHQPIYEAVSVGIAESLGLEVPRYFVLENQDGEVKFVHNHEIPAKKRLDEKRPYFFVSKIVTLPETEDLKVIEEKMASEKFYRDLLMFADVSKKKQNHALIQEPGNSYILYIDLGCSFIDAVSGCISQRNAVSQLTRDNRGFPLRSLKKDLRHAEDCLKKYAIITNHRQENRKDIISPSEFVGNIPKLPVPIFPLGSKPLEQMLTEEELEEIMNLVKINMCQVLKDYTKTERANEIIVRN